MTLTIPRTGLSASPHLSIGTAKDSWIGAQGALNATTAWGTANRAIYIPVRVPRQVVVRKLGFVSQSTGTGNCDMGIYSSSGTRLVSSGSFAKGTTTVVQVVDVTDTTLQAGSYYLALNNDTTSDTFQALSVTAPYPAALGVLTEAVGAVTLPATATWAINNTLAFVPNLHMFLVTEVA